jgi:hypothetical protein
MSAVKAYALCGKAEQAPEKVLFPSASQEIAGIAPPFVCPLKAAEGDSEAWR